MDILTLLDRAVALPPPASTSELSLAGLPGLLAMPPEPTGLVVFARTGGRQGQCSTEVARALGEAGVASLRLALDPAGAARDRWKALDVQAQAERLQAAVAALDEATAALPLGLYGSGTSAAVVLHVAAELGGRVAAVVSRGGRPDLAVGVLPRVQAPGLFIVGARDRMLLHLHQWALERMHCERLLQTVPQAGSLFQEPGQIACAADLAVTWFRSYLGRGRDGPRFIPTRPAARNAPRAGLH